MITDLKELLEQEQRLQFRQFDHQTAWELGSLLKRNAEQLGVAVAIDIRINGFNLFRYAMQGTSADNLAWIERKTNVVNRYGHSSWYMGQYYQAKGKTIEQSSLVKLEEFAPYGGSFPIRLHGCGVVGSITVSGLPQYEDHLLVTNTIAEYLKQTQQ